MNFSVPNIRSVLSTESPPYNSSVRISNSTVEQIEENGVPSSQNDNHGNEASCSSVKPKNKKSKKQLERSENEPLELIADQKVDDAQIEGEVKKESIPTLVSPSAKFDVRQQRRKKLLNDTTSICEFDNEDDEPKLAPEEKSVKKQKRSPVVKKGSLNYHCRF